MPIAATWVDLEMIILSEVNKRKVNIFYCLHVEPKKKKIQVNLLTKQTQTLRHRKWGGIN